MRSTSKSDYELILYDIPSPSPEQLRSNLQSKGFHVHVVADFGQLVSASQRIDNPVLVVDTGEEQDEAVRHIRQLIDEKSLQAVPLVLIGRDVDVSERILNQSFPVAAAVSRPCTTNDIIEGIAYVIRTWETKRRDKAAAETVVPPESVTPQQTLAPQHALYKEYTNVAELLFNLLQKNNLTEKVFGGHLYPTLSHEERIQRLEILPQGAEGEALRVVHSEGGKWTRCHLLRTAFIADRIATALQFPDKQRLTIKSLCLYFGCAFRGKDQDLLWRDYAKSNAQLLRKEICSRVKDGAMKVAIDHQQPALGNLLALLGRLIGGEESIKEEESYLSASLVMGCELADRICFQSGFWSPRSAYHLLRRFKSGKLNELHPMILASLMKFLSESIAASPSALLLPKAIREDPKLLEEARKLREEPVGNGEAKIPLNSLEPGMRLSRPLRAFDGKQVLSEDLVLDEDLIMRIWQLAAIRPLNAPVIITKEASS
ncbi:MAG: hypothetical protein QY326_02940 [Bdellovibrionota bacterium]|nr:MAG: hypothetical protein QY326_02940 [Bdellovibrionota bacterium]